MSPPCLEEVDVKHTPIKSKEVSVDTCVRGRMDSVTGGVWAKS